MVRKAPSEFNESRFISMAIYNEFLLSVFLNVSMLFLQSPANPDLLYIIFFCHTQLTVTLLLCLIFGSKAYMVFKGHGKSEDTLNTAPKLQITKFLNKPRSGNSQHAISTNSSTAGPESKITEQDVQEEFKLLYLQLEHLNEKSKRQGNRHLTAKINAMREAGRMDLKEVAEEEKKEIKTSDKACETTELPQIECSTCKEITRHKTTSVEPNSKTPESPINKKITHPIVLNLDDKTRFTEEVTV